MINYGVTEFVGIIIVIGLFAYLTNALQWGLFQILRDFFEDQDDEEKVSKVLHYHFHYKAKK